MSFSMNYTMNFSSMLFDGIMCSIFWEDNLSDDSIFSMFWTINSDITM